MRPSIVRWDTFKVNVVARYSKSQMGFFLTIYEDVENTSAKCKRCMTGEMEFIQWVCQSCLRRPNLQWIATLGHLGSQDPHDSKHPDLDGGGSSKPLKLQKDKNNGAAKCQKPSTEFYRSTQNWKIRSLKSRPSGCSPISCQRSRIQRKFHATLEHTWTNFKRGCHSSRRVWSAHPRGWLHAC